MADSDGWTVQAYAKVALLLRGLFDLGIAVSVADPDADERFIQENAEAQVWLKSIADAEVS